VKTKRSFAEEMAEREGQQATLRAARDLIREERKAAVRVGRSGSMFSVSPGVQSIYGRLKVTPEIEGVYSSAGGSPFANEVSLVEYALAFANGDTDRSDSELLLKSNEELRRYIADDDPDPDSALRADDRLIARKRSELRDFLSRVVLDRQSAIDSLMTSKEPLEIEYMPDLFRSSNGVRLRPHAIFPNERAFQVCVFTLLLDDSKPSPKSPPPLELCQCKECKRFFLLKRGGGRARRGYCRDRHMQQFHARTSTERANKSRQKKARKPK
jgi:hypothetical protein